MVQKGLKKFLNDLEKVFKMVWWRGTKWNHIKRIFEVELFFSSQNIDLPFYLKRLLELSFFFSFFFQYFFFLFLSLFIMLRLLRTWGFWWYLRRKITSSITSFQMKWCGVVKYGYRRWTHILEWSYVWQYG
jgi:hypothetical protein